MQDFVPDICFCLEDFLRDFLVEDFTEHLELVFDTFLSDMETTSDVLSDTSGDHWEVTWTSMYNPKHSVTAVIKMYLVILAKVEIGVIHEQKTATQMCLQEGIIDLISRVQSSDYTKINSCS